MLTADAVGGVWQYTTELASGFRDRGAEVLLVALGPPPNPSQCADAAVCTLRITGLALDWLASGPDELSHAAQELAEHAAAWGADTIQLHSPAYASLTDWPAPVIAAAHSCVGTWWRAVRQGPLPLDLAWRADLVAGGITAADIVLTPSHSFARALADSYKLDRDICTVWNGRLPLPVQRAPCPHVFTAGRLWDEAKNITSLDVAARKSGIQVRAAGPAVAPHGGTIDCRHLHLLGTIRQAELAREYSHAALFVSPARYEPFGLAVLEAAQASCPLLLGDIPTFRELWDDAAIFVHPDDTDQLATEMTRMMADANARERCGAAAKERSQRYTSVAMVTATWAVHCTAMAAEPAMFA